VKPRFHHLLFAFLLLCAQAFAAAHAVEHAMEEGQGLPAHVCELCLAAHDLGVALNGDVAALSIVARACVPAAFFLHGRAALPAPQARQQSPPSA
jgi:hypothetical protein